MLPRRGFTLKNVKIPECPCCWVHLGPPLPHLKAPQETHILVTLFRASPAVHSVCDPAKNIFHIQVLVISPFFFFSTSPRTHNNWNWDSKIGGGTTNSKLPGPISTMGEIRNTEQQSGHIYYTLFFSAGAQSCCTFYQPLQTPQWCWAKTNFLS